MRRSAAPTSWSDDGSPAAATLQTRRLSIGSRTWKWVREHGIVIYGALAITYMLIPIALIVVFSFNDPRTGTSLDFTIGTDSPSSTGRTLSRSGTEQCALVSLRLAALATLISTCSGR